MSIEKVIIRIATNDNEDKAIRYFLDKVFARGAYDARSLHMIKSVLKEIIRSENNLIRITTNKLRACKAFIMDWRPIIDRSSYDDKSFLVFGVIEKVVNLFYMR